MRIAARQSVLLFLDRQIEQTMDFQNLAFVIRLMYISFSVTLTRRPRACSIQSSPNANRHGSRGGQAHNEGSVSVRGNRQAGPSCESPGLQRRVPRRGFSKAETGWTSTPASGPTSLLSGKRCPMRAKPLPFRITGPSPSQQLGFN